MLGRSLDSHVERHRQRVEKLSEEVSDEYCTACSPLKVP